MFYLFPFLQFQKSKSSQEQDQEDPRAIQAPYLTTFLLQVSIHQMQSARSWDLCCFVDSQDILQSLMILMTSARVLIEHPQPPPGRKNITPEQSLTPSLIVSWILMRQPGKEKIY